MTTTEMVLGYVLGGLLGLGFLAVGLLHIRNEVRDPRWKR